MNQDYLRAYANLLVQTGLHIIPGDSIQMTLSPEAIPLARLITEAAYKAGALRVYTELYDSQNILARYRYASSDSFAEVPAYDVDIVLKRYENRTHRLYLNSPDPELLKGIDGQLISDWNKVSAEALRPLDAMILGNRVKWLVAAVPGHAWAAKVFPDLPADEALERLWELVFQACRCNLPDPVQAWAAHDAELKRVETHLNDARFDRLVYRGPGTSLEVGLVEGHRWVGGSSEFGDGESFMANIPTEEIFTMPHRDRVNGRIAATLPLSWQGLLIRDFWFQFENGIVTDFGAAEGRDVLERMLATDDSANRLGEAALVSVDSPIYQTDVLFYSTLFDENASCHFALGSAYEENLHESAGMTKEARTEHGMNESLIHVDFMVGSDKLDITGIKKDGSELTVMKGGRFAF